MTANKIATYGAIGLCALAAWYLTRERPATAAARVQPGEQARQAALWEFKNTMSQQWATLAGASVATPPYFGNQP